MKKFLTTISILFLLSSNLVAFAAFSDVTSSHKNYDAILYLQENNIINGYSDGTFKPDNTVNRAEFLKIILEGSNIRLNITENTPFSDVDNNAWYAPYLKKAYDEGWIDGYPDGTFKPAQEINKVEALKIVGEVQNWNLPETITNQPFDDVYKTTWYSAYVFYAKTNNFLEETGNLYNPADFMTRGGISEVIYRTIAEDKTAEDNENSQQQETEEPEENEEDSQDSDDNDEFTQINDFAAVSTTFFDEISLDSSLPNIFYKNEIYVIEGNTNSSSYDEITVIIEKENNGDRKTYTANVNNKSFAIPVYFKSSGTYLMGILPGEEGETKAIRVYVNTNLPENTNTETSPSKANSIDINHEDDQTFVEFNAISSTLKKLKLSQGNKSVTYYSRQNLNQIPVNYSDFENFSENSVNYYIETAKLSSEKPLEISSDFTKSETKSFQATTHQFDEIKTNKISANPKSLISSSQNISFSGTVSTETKLNAQIIKPDGFVTEVELSSSSPTSDYYGETVINSGGNFSFSYTPDSDGTYIVEINDKEGIAILNHPVYRGGEIPLLPDYFDLNPRENTFEGTFNVNSMRQSLLSYINDARNDHGLSEISLSDDLNSLAQDHANDMQENNYFSHYNLSGQTPDQRRIAAGLATAVSENIAKDISIAHAHYGLMRSAAHRDNILGPDWSRVGIGIALTSDGYLIITQEFTTGEIDANTLENYKTELLNEINDLRADNSIADLTETESLNSAGTYLNDKVINEDQTINQSLFDQALSTHSVTGSTTLIGRTYNIWSQILNSILSDEEDKLTESTWQNIGIDIQLDNEGMINTLLLLNRP